MWKHLLRSLPRARPKHIFTTVCLLLRYFLTYTVLDRARLPTAALRRLAAAILQLTRDPDRMGIVGRLYAMAHRRGDDDAGYSWATMVLEGYLKLPNEAENKAQIASAMDVYAALAHQGHPQAQFGMGRLLLARLAQNKEEHGVRDKQVRQAVELWQRAGRNGMADAWYELGACFRDISNAGRLYHQGGLLPRSEARAITCFEHGARNGSALASYALGVLYNARSAASEKRGGDPSLDAALATRYFLQAAQKGNAPSAYNMGLRYMGDAEERDAHKARWGVMPDDASAREWFAAAASKSMSLITQNSRRLFASHDELRRDADGGAWCTRYDTARRPRGSEASVLTSASIGESRATVQGDACT